MVNQRSVCHLTFYVIWDTGPGLLYKNPKDIDRNGITIYTNINTLPDHFMCNWR